MNVEEITNLISILSENRTKKKSQQTIFCDSTVPLQHQQKIVKLILFSCKALLLNQSDSKSISNIEILNLFHQRFIETGVVSIHYLGMILQLKKYLEHHIIEQFPEEIYQQQALNLAYTVLNLTKINYNNSATKNTLDKKMNVNDSVENLKENGMEILDLQGVACPFNFIKAKLKLQEMKKNSILTIYLDAGEPIDNVPLSLKEEGHVIMDKQWNGSHYSLKVKNKG